MVDVYHANQANLSHHDVNTTIHISSILVELDRETPKFKSMEQKTRYDAKTTKVDYA